MTHENTGRMVVVPRAVVDKYVLRPFAELADAAARGDDGLSFATRDHGCAWMREGTSAEPALRGRAVIYFQGWI